MSVFVRCHADTDSWSLRARAAIGLAGSKTQFVQGDTVVIPMNTRVVLASSTMPLSAIAAFFASPAAQLCRKIVIVEGEGATALPLFDLADMLVFSVAGLANLLGLERTHDDAAALVAVQILLERDNQAAVVHFPGNAATAIWADRTLDVTGRLETTTKAHSPASAAVDQGIGPEPALVMALAAAVPLPTPQAVR